MTMVEWEDWCGRDSGFKEVWLGLGIWQAMLDDGSASADAKLDELGLKLGFAQRVARCVARGVRIPWSYPASARVLQAVPPSLWFEAVSFADADLPHWRVVKGDDSGPGNEHSWRQPLVAPRYPIVAASDDLVTAAPQLRLGWPLRIGYFDQNKPDIALQGLLARVNQTAGRLTRQVSLGRDRAKCDLLVFWGTAAQLIKQVEASNGRIKTNLLMLISPDIPEPETEAALCDLVRASGIMVLDHSTAIGNVEGALHGFIVEFSHGQPCDVALRRGMEEQVRVHVLRLREALAGVTIRDVASTLKHEFDKLPDDAVMPGADVLERVLRPSTAPPDVPDVVLRLAGGGNVRGLAA